MQLYYKKDLKIYARKLRAQMTNCEQLLWRKIRGRQLSNVQFYRQKPAGSYILDFYSKFPKIAIELDGSQHLLAEHLERDVQRDQFLRSLGIKVLRFSNLEIMQNLAGVLEVINDIIIANIPPLVSAAHALAESSDPLSKRVKKKS